MNLERLNQLLLDVWKTRDRLGERIAQEAGPTDLSKRQCLLEKEIYETLVAKAGKILTLPVRIVVEGYRAVENDQARHTLYVDPLDGTASTARWRNTGILEHGLPITTVLSMAPNKLELKFGDFVAAAALDLNSGQQWLAMQNQGALTCSAADLQRKTLFRVKNYPRHSPRLACEFYRHINWATRLLVNQAVEWTDMPSSFMNILLAVLVETDCFFNNVVPEFSHEGQRGHELGAISVFARELGAYAIDTRTGQPLFESLFTFDGMTPCIVGVDRDTVEYYWTMIRENLDKPFESGMMRDVNRRSDQSMARQRWTHGTTP